MFSCDFATKDGGGVFEKKMLLARLMRLDAADADVVLDVALVALKHRVP